MTLVLGHVTDKAHKFHLTFELSDSLGPIQVAVTMERHSCSSQHARLLKLVIKNGFELFFNLRECLVLSVALRSELLILDDEVMHGCALEWLSSALLPVVSVDVRHDFELWEPLVELVQNVKVFSGCVFCDFLRVKAAHRSQESMWVECSELLHWKNQSLNQRQ